MSLTLKNNANGDVVFTLKNRNGNTAVFTNAGTTGLLGRATLSLQLVERANTNRVIGKLSVPTVVDDVAASAVPVVAYTEVGSFDLSAVLAATAADALDFTAMFKSLVSNQAVIDMYLSGTIPS